MGGPVRETVAEIGSTNDGMRARVQAGAAEGGWLRAERQTGGRGRLGRTWQSPPGNLYASTLVRLHVSDPIAPSLALVAAVALDEAAAAFVDPGRLRIKWPNDLLLAMMEGGAIAWRKAAGILLERVGDAVVIGFGVNLAEAPDLADRKVARLKHAAGGPIDPAILLDALADATARWLGIWRGQGLAAVRERWLLRAHPPGTSLSARTADGGAIEGAFAGLDADGALLLRTPERLHVIAAGDVFLL